MDPSLSIASLQIGITKGTISVKVLSLWISNPKSLEKQCRMILADAEGSRMEATIPHPYYLRSFVNEIFEGNWYLLTNFMVIENPEPFRNTTNPMIIKFSYKTKMNQFDDVTDPCLLEFMKFPEILNHENDSSDVPIDLFGMILKVSKVKGLPYVPKEDEVAYMPKYRDIVLVDNEGNLLKATTMGDSCSSFSEMWLNSGFDIKRRSDEVFCVMKFWSISGFEGDRCIITGEGCSKILLNPKIAELEEDEEMCRVTYPYYTELVDESEDEIE
ncbi:uncharacterized protein LOC111832155 [Capsella rubella]|uniref:uncharacterized protein LOC111832155 n=1 Tax=Capsella rubella TaxID=81985 RepID=UPI000CD4D476|nr:uncharacterized protein LOC111832155 [Capsella rubella]